MPEPGEYGYEEPHEDLLYEAEARFADAIKRIEALRDEARRNQLVTYCSNVGTDKVKPEEVGQETLSPGCVLGYELASRLSTERLQQLFEEDDWGAAWSLHDGEDTEYFENDEGAIRAYDAALLALREAAEKPRVNERRADLGANLSACNPDWGKDELETDVLDALANVVHYLRRVGIDPDDMFDRALGSAQGDLEDGPEAGYDPSIAEKHGVWKHDE